jgi:hypothetical protein
VSMPVVDSREGEFVHARDNTGEACRGY